MYIWQVKVRTSAGWSSYSSARQFIVDIPPNAPTLNSPASGAAYSLGGSGSFSWSAPSGVSVERYIFRIVSGTDLNQNQKVHKEPATSPNNETFSDVAYDPGTHTWAVRAIKKTPAGYDQSTYETTIDWGPYATRTFTLAQQPFDLTASLNVTGAIPTNAARGSAVTIKCTVNKSGGALPDPDTYVRVYLYLSQSNTSLTGAREICGEACAFDFNKTLLTDGTETLQKTVSIPADIEGPFYVLAVVDGPNRWAESDENNNFASSQSTLAVWRPGTPSTNDSDGILARTWDNPSVYWVTLYNTKWHIVGSDADPGSPLHQLGYADADVQWYGSGALAGLVEGKKILDDNNFVYRVQGSSPEASVVYIIRNGVSDWFENWEAFINSQFGTDDVYWATPTGLSWIQTIHPKGQLIGLQPRLRVIPDKLFFIKYNINYTTELCTTIFNQNQK